MKIKWLLNLSVITLLSGFFNIVNAQKINTFHKQDNGKQVFILENDKVRYAIAIEDNKLFSDTLSLLSSWVSAFQTNPFSISSNADFLLDIFWTDWNAPDKTGNADNAVRLAKSDFSLTGFAFHETENEGKELEITLNGIKTPFTVKMTYRLDPGDFYVKHKLSICDTVYETHFLNWIYGLDANITGIARVIKKGGFGQPVAFVTEDGGGFFGLEYPASTNSIESVSGNIFNVSCGQEFGCKITKDWIESDWIVEALIPEHAVRKWFMDYVDDIRVSPVKPYTLYNSWYDLRSPEFRDVPPENIMNQENIFRIMHLLQENMIEKHGIKLDAFVLDDGWDVYASDWVLQKESFPNGLKPISDELKKSNTNLGMWFGPTGGYSYRAKRINWMKEHGYETVGKEKEWHTAMMCLAGTRYSNLFRERTVDFVNNDNVRYFKWDGIQFSCSEPDHGHPLGIYSRRAVMESVIDKCDAVRKDHKDVFINITSGTWLSPWWVKYANQIWMDAEDYGYADIPSFSPRDAAITYRDLALYNDFHKKDLWFPISNMMTHGIIKGTLEKLGGENEPLDKFTDECLLYLARGVSMWELYISPDILTESEWNAIAGSIHWAEENFDILKNTEMIGGDPAKGQTYGYAHFKGNRGILALRNPIIEDQSITIKLDPGQGLDPKSSSLVLEKVYPTNWISPDLFSAGAEIDTPLKGYETAVYEIYPLSEANQPLIAGAEFDIAKKEGIKYQIKLYQAGDKVRLLNPEIVESLTLNGNPVNLYDLSINNSKESEIVKSYSAIYEDRTRQKTLQFQIDINLSVSNNMMAILFKPDKDSNVLDFPEKVITTDNNITKSEEWSEKGEWQFITFNVTAGKHTITAEFTDNPGWTGKAFIYLISQQQMVSNDLLIETRQTLSERLIPPKPLPIGMSKVITLLGEMEIK
jgi:hypothetical protein